MEATATHPFEVAETLYYAAVFVVAFLSSVSQALRGTDPLSCRNAVNIGLVSGFLAFTVVSFVDGDRADRAGNEFFYLGLASLIGLGGKYHAKIIGALIKLLAKKIGIENLNLDDDDEDDAGKRSP